MSYATKNGNLQLLNQISSIVSEGDIKIWENAAYSSCIQKQTEKIKSEIVSLKAAIKEKQKESKMLDDYVAQFDKTNSTLQETLKVTEQSVLMHESLKENLVQEENKFKNLYTTTLEKYNDELKEYRTIYENASKSYKDLKNQQIATQKLEVKKMLLDAQIASLEKSRRQFNTIQKQIFHKTVVRFADFYVTYHKSELMKKQAHETKKVEQQLLKEHLQLTETVKEKKRNYEMKLKMNSKSVSKIDNSAEKITQESNDTDKLKKFLNEDILPCSLTALPQPTVDFNENKSKVKILDVKVMQPPPLRSVLTTKSKPELRKKMQDMMLSVKKETKRSSSSQTASVNFPSRQTSQQIHNENDTPSTSQQSQVQSKLVKSQSISQNKMNSQMSEYGLQSKLNSQIPQRRIHSQRSNSSSQKHDDQLVLPIGSSVTKNLGDLGATQPHLSKETGILSILKPTNRENVEKIDTKEDNISKFFNSKKKAVSFQNVEKQGSPRTDIKKFALFTMEDRQMPSGKTAENFNAPFSFKNQMLLNQNKVIDNEMSIEISDETKDTEDGTGNGFTLPTFATTGSDLEQMNELEFDGLDHNFEEPPLNLTDNFTAPVESTTFNFFGSQGTSGNMFCFP